MSRGAVGRGISRKLLPFVLVASLAAPLAIAEPPTRSVIEGTLVDRADLVFALPGYWKEKPLDGGVEFWRGEHEQLIAAVYAPPDGKRGADAVQMMSTVQRLAVEQVCESGGNVSKAEPVKISGLVAVRFTASCQKPQMVSTLVAATAHERMLSFEYYDYHAKPNLAAHAVIAARILGTVRLKPLPTKAR